MKITRMLCGVIAALAIVGAMCSMAVMDHAHAAVSLSGASLAMAGMVTLKAPITLHYDGQYVAPGTEVELTKEEADRLTAAHGAFGGPGEPDPGNTQMRNVDIASIKALNEQASIHKGHGKTSGSSESGEDGIKRADLERMNRDKLVETATELKVEHPTDATRAQIIDAIMTAQDKAKA